MSARKPRSSPAPFATSNFCFQISGLQFPVSGSRTPVSPLQLRLPLRVSACPASPLPPHAHPVGNQRLLAIVYRQSAIVLHAPRSHALNLADEIVVHVGPLSQALLSEAGLPGGIGESLRQTLSGGMAATGYQSRNGNLLPPSMLCISRKLPQSVPKVSTAESFHLRLFQPHVSSAPLNGTRRNRKIT